MLHSKIFSLTLLNVMRGRLTWEHIRRKLINFTEGISTEGWKRHELEFRLMVIIVRLDGISNIFLCNKNYCLK